MKHEIVTRNGSIHVRNFGCADDCRPVVVIDPEDREQVDRLEAAFAAHCGWHLIGAEQRRGYLQAALREFANSQPPKPEEPADPAARVTDRRENTWRLLADGDWVCTSGPDSGEYLTWPKLTERGPLAVEIGA